MSPAATERRTPDRPTDPHQPAPPPRRRTVQLGVGLAEVMLILVGLRFVIGDQNPAVERRYLLLWDSLATAYLVIGLFLASPLHRR